MSLLDFDTLTFDCYGTLIDWEKGLLEAVRRHLPGAPGDEDVVLETFGRFESEEEKATPDLVYPEILARVHGRLAGEWGLEGTADQAQAFGASVPQWPAFDDSPGALAILKRHFRLVILSNVDRESFAASNRRLGVEFDHIFTAQDIGSYKPDPRNFDYALQYLAEAGVAKEKILHTAQSLFHDHAPASRIGLATCWIDRRHAKDGWGATKAPGADFNTQVDVDYRFESLAAMADAVEAEAASRG